MALQYLADRGGGFRRTLSDTSPVVEKNPFTIARRWHSTLRAYYQNTMYENAEMWQAYRATYRLPRDIRSIYNPTHRAVENWSGRIYPGAWTNDGRPLPDGTPHVLQFPSDVIDDRPELVLATIQLLNWGGWQSNRTVYVKEAAIIGTVFVEIIDDVEKGKVFPQIIPIEWVANAEVNTRGNVKSYDLQYPALDEETGKQFSFRKVVTSDSITEYRDDRVTRDDPNPYGFVPAVWVKHRSTSKLFGAPVIDGVITKIDEINRLTTKVHKYYELLQGAPQVFFTKQAPAPIGQKAGPTDDLGVADIAESIRWLHSTDTDGRVVPMMQAVNIDGAGVRIDKLMEEIESDLPELTIDKQLREMQNVTGPGADRMMGDVRGRFDEVQANADAGTVKLIQMGIAIAGWRMSTGAWGSRSQLDREQIKFAGFDLDSFRAGLLDLSLLPRPLVPSTEMERLASLQVRKDVAGLSDDEVRRELGYDDAKIAQLNTENAADTERMSVGAF